MLNILLESYIFLIPVGIFILYFLLKYPEVSFALFINAYVVKGGINFGYFNLTAILLVVTVVGFILKQLIKRDEKMINLNFKLESSDKFILLFMAVLVIGCIYSLNRNGGIIKTLRFIVLVFIPYLLARIFLLKDAQVKLFLISVSITALTVSVLLVLISIFGNYTGGRMYFLQANPIPVSVLLMVGLIIFFIGITQKIFNEWKYGKIFCALAIIPLLYSIFLVGSRGPIISAIVGLIFGVFILIKTKIKGRNTTIIWIISLILILVGTSCFDIIYSSLFTNKIIPGANKIIPNMERFSLKNAKDLSVIGRLDLYSTAWQLFKSKPLFGIGTGGFRLGEHQYPHNIFLEIAAENGLFGLIIFFGFLFAICQKGYHFLNKNILEINKQARVMGLIILVVAISLIVERQFSFGLDMHKDLFVFFGIIVNLPLTDWGSSKDKMLLNREI
jgi:O-antigen ligase